MIRYFLPELDMFFQSYHIAPEYFSNSWLLTIFAVKIENLQLVYSLWGELARVDDPFYMILLCIALLDLNKELFRSQICFIMLKFYYLTASDGLYSPIYITSHILFNYLFLYWTQLLEYWTHGILTSLTRPLQTAVKQS